MHEDTDTPLQSLLDHVGHAMNGGDAVDLKTLVESFGNRAFGPVMLLCGLCMMTPLGAIPGIPPAFGLIVIVFAVQLLFRRPSPWMPKILGRVKIPASKLKTVQDKTRPVLAKIDGVIRPRLQWAARGPMVVIAALIAIILALTFFPLGAIPFGVVPPAFVVGLLGLGLTARDGILIITALTLGCAAITGIGILLLTGVQMF